MINNNNNNINNSMNNNNFNIEKRLKKFTKEMTLYKSHPNYEDIKQLYINGVIKTITSAESKINKIKITKEGKVYKTSLTLLNQIKLDVLKIKEQELLNKNLVGSSVLKIDKKFLDKKESNGEYWDEKTNIIEFQNLERKNKNYYYVQTVEYFLGNGKQINDIILFSKDEFYDYHTNIFNTIKIDSTFKQSVKYNMTLQGGNYGYMWKCRALINGYDEKCYSIITTKAYKNIPKVKNINLKQLYQDNITKTCVYDAFLSFFDKRQTENKMYKAMYNKLKNNESLKKAYTDETLCEIMEFCNSSILIKDFILGEDKYLKHPNSRYCVELLNTKYNHLDLLVNKYNEVEEVETINEYCKIKNDNKFYIEKMGQLITLDKSYKIKDSKFNKIYSQWKEDVKYSTNFINMNDDEYKLIEKYDYVLHTFFNDFEVNNDKYYELDLKKAYYNYSNIEYNKYYNGLPSGAFINVKVNNNFTIEHFIEQYNNQLIGFYEVKIIKIKSKHNHFKTLGFNLNKNYVLTSCQIHLLKDYLDFEFLNLSFSPSVHMPFNEQFLEKEKGISHYCKAYGILFKNNQISEINIKPLECDLNYYSLIQNDKYEIYKVDEIVKIIETNPEPKTRLHLAYYIHSYIRTLIMDQILNMDINDVFGVKLDSIVCKNNISSKIAFFNNNFSIKEGNKLNDLFSIKECNIENMLVKNKKCDLDFGLSTENSYNNSYYRSYIYNNDEEINFPLSFLQTDEVITSRVILLEGMGGSGKTYSIMKNLNNKYLCYTSSCWNLIQNKMIESRCIGLSLPKLTGYCDGKKSIKVVNNNIKFILNDELTLQDKSISLHIINDFKNCFVFLLGDIENDFFYQCSLPKLSIINSKDYKMQCVKYFKNYRFDDELNQKLLLLRKFQKDNRFEDNRNKLIFDYVKLHFKDHFYKREDIIFNDNDIGISDINDIKNESELTNYFINKGTTPQYYIKNTNLNFKQYKGAKLNEIPTHNNYECKLFKTIHSFQGLDIPIENKLIISVKQNFDYNLWYTALSRVKTLRQIYIID